MVLPCTQVRRTALHWAMRGGHTGVVQYLVENNIRVDAVDKVAMCVVMLLSSTTDGLTTCICCAQFGEVALHQACQKSHSEAARYLIRAGCQVNIANKVQ